MPEIQVKTEKPDLRKLFDKEVETQCLQYLAEMRKPPEVVDLLIRDFQAKWGLRTDTEEGKDYVISLRTKLHSRAKYYLWNPDAEKKRQQIERLRERWKTHLDDYVRESNKAARIAEYAKIAQAAYKDGVYSAAVQALLAIAREKGELLPENQIYQQININNYETLPDAELQVLLEKAFKQIGINSGAERDIAKRLIEGGTNVSSALASKAE